jgi:hypothetical protein
MINTIRLFTLKHSGQHDDLLLVGPLPEKGSSINTS